MFHFPCGFLLHIRIAKYPTATRRLLQPNHLPTNPPNTSMHAIILRLLLYAITQQAHNCSRTPGHGAADQQRPETPNVDVGGCQDPSRMRLRPSSLGTRAGHDWKPAQCHVANVDSIVSIRYSICCMRLYLIHHQLRRRWEHHWS